MFQLKLPFAVSLVDATNVVHGEGKAKGIRSKIVALFASKNATEVAHVNALPRLGLVVLPVKDRAPPNGGHDVHGGLSVGCHDTLMAETQTYCWCGDHYAKTVCKKNSDRAASSLTPLSRYIQQ